MERLHAKELVIGDLESQHVRIEANRLYMTDKCLQIRADLQVTRDGSPCLTLYDGNGTSRITVQVEHNGMPFITLRDGNFTRRLEMNLGEDEGDAELSIYGKSDKCVFTMGTMHNEEVALRVPGKNGLEPWQPKKGA